MKQVALNIVKSAFAGKKDKGGKPYIDHLMFVAYNAEKYFLNPTEEHKEMLFIIGLLHDLLEDCPDWKGIHIYTIFQSNIISNALKYLTKDNDTEYSLYIQGIKDHSYARAVKLADLEHNMDITRLKEVTDKDIERIKKYHQAYNSLLNKK